MAFKTLRTAFFRNLADTEINVQGKNIFLVGENGQGKTNFLEAFYFCSYGSSFRGVKDADLVRNGEKDFSVQVELDAAACGRISVKVENNRKTITLDGKKIEDRKDLLETSPPVVFCHEDMEFVSGTQERRRWFFDQTQSLYDPVYLDDLRKYRRVLKSRGGVLRENRGFMGNCAGPGGVESLLDILDFQLAEYGLRLMEKRRAAAARFSTVFSPLYEEVSGISGIGVDYVPSWKQGGGPECTVEVMVHRLAERRPADLAKGVTLSGPHRDRYVFVRRNAAAGETCPGTVDFAETASTGQRRLLALLLRVAQVRCFSGVTGKAPVLLLDDVLLELDGEKRRRFLSVLPDYEQAFFTFLPEEPYQNYRGSDTLVYTVKAGVLSRTGA